MIIVGSTHLLPVMRLKSGRIGEDILSLEIQMRWYLNVPKPQVCKLQFTAGYLPRDICFSQG